MMDIIETYRPLCSAICALIPHELEIVLHDLRSGTIALMENSLSLRKAGDPSYIEQEGVQEEINDQGFIGPYAKTNSDGSRMKSVTLPLYNEEKERIALLCFNLRVEKFAEMERLMGSLRMLAEADQPEALMKSDWREQAHDLLGKVLNSRKTTLAACRREDKIAILSAMDETGIFEYRGSADYIASMLAMSRASLYALLKASREMPPVSLENKNDA